MLVILQQWHQGPLVTARTEHAATGDANFDTLVEDKMLMILMDWQQ